MKKDTFKKEQKAAKTLVKKYPLSQKYVGRARKAF